MPRSARIRRPSHHRPARPAASSIGFPVRAAFVTIGVIGLAGLALALFGPARFEREVLAPVREAVEPRAEKLWIASRPLRDRIGLLFEAAGNERTRLVEDFRRWIDGFHAA